MKRKNIWKYFFSFLKGKEKIIVYCLVTNLMCTAMEIIMPLLQKEAIDRFVVTQNIDGIKPFILKYLLCVFIHAGTMIVFVKGAINLEMTYEDRMRNRAISHIQKLPISFYNRVSSGDILARVGADIDKISDLIVWDMIMLSWSIPAAVGSVGVMFYLNKKLALIVLLVIPILIFVMSKFNNKIFNAGKIARKQNGKIVSFFHEGIKAYKTTRILAAELDQEEKFISSTKRLRKLNVEEMLLRTKYVSITTFIASLMAIVVLIKGSYDMGKGLVNAGVISAFLAYLIQLIFPIQASATGIAELTGLRGTMERVRDFFEEEEIVEINNKDKEDFFLKDIELKNVTFSYDKKENIIEDFSLKFKAGSVTALVGATGAGKSTIIQLIMRYFDPQKGEISVGGVNLQKFNRATVRSEVGCILQDPPIFKGTVYENIAIGKKDATDEEIREAGRKALLTNLNRKAADLSQGEKQMLAFARVFLRNPSILILDEATSNVDLKTEEKLNKAAKEILKGRTAIVIAHRLSTVRDADNIALLDRGKIVEMGDHEELIRKNGAYLALVSKENGEYKL